LFDLDHSGGFELEQSPDSDSRRQAGGPQPRTPEAHRVLAALRKDHAVKFNQRRPGWSANAVAPVKLKTAIMRNAGERLFGPLPAQRTRTIPSRAAGCGVRRRNCGAQLVDVVEYAVRSVGAFAFANEAQLQPPFHPVLLCRNSP
jgi:hypothetical protein